MILITTPTGDIGSRVLRHLTEGSAELRVLARNPNRLPTDIVDRVEVAHGSHADKQSLEEALVGVHGVFWLPPGSPQSASAHAAYVEFSKAFCNALPDSSVTHAVGISALGRGWPRPAGLVTSSIEMDDLIGKTGVHYRALACASLMDNALRQLDAIRSGEFYQPTPGDVRLPHVAKSDVAQAASNLLLDRTWRGVADVPMCGPEDLSFHDIVETMSDTLGWSVQFHHLPMEAFEGMLRSQGASASMSRAYVDMMTAKNEGMDSAHVPDDRRHTPTTFRQWCRQDLQPALEAST